MKVTIIGSGELKFIPEYSGIDRNKLDRLLEDSAKLLVELGAEIIVLPAGGIPYEFAKLYKKFGGKKVYGVIPVNCPFYGDATDKIIGDFRDVIDEEIHFNSWYDIDGNIATLGDFTLCFGFTAGVMAEIAEMKYNLVYKKRKTKLIIFENTFSRRLHEEIGKDIPQIYINSVEELKGILENEN